MSVEINDRLKLRPSVAVVSNDDVTEFFLSDIRKTIVLRMQQEVAKLLFGLDGTKSIAEFLEANGLSGQTDEVLPLLDFLNENSVLLKVDQNYGKDYNRYPRVYSLLENYLACFYSISNHIYTNLNYYIVNLLQMVHSQIALWLTLV